MPVGRGCRRAGSAPGPGSRRPAPPPTRRGSAPAARRPARGRSPPAGAGRRTERSRQRAHLALVQADQVGQRLAPVAAAPPDCRRGAGAAPRPAPRPPLWRGSRLEYGSWKTICTSRPRARRSLGRPGRMRAVAAAGPDACRRWAAPGPRSCGRWWSCPTPTRPRSPASRRRGIANDDVVDRRRPRRTSWSARRPPGPAQPCRHQRSAGPRSSLGPQAAHPAAGHLGRWPGSLADSGPAHAGSAGRTRSRRGASKAETGRPGMAASRCRGGVDAGPGAGQRGRVGVQRIVVQERRLARSRPSARRT